VFILLEKFPDESRSLVVGRFHFTPTTTSALHVLCDLNDERVLDSVTAYIPQRPWWVSPTQRGKKMSKEPGAPCSECGGAVRTRRIKQEFEREGIRVSVSGIRALVCSRCGAVYFAPGGAQAVVEAANGLFALARQNRQSRGRLSAAVS
jgi:YgiT-type zinc finger domain-containing protein